jgi:acyl CoA:acetate/3-ketoacid CoA transferase alpha subunit/acyl CoA:acetate/3-ketoacid CoA transferase beta subunit
VIARRIERLHESTEDKQLDLAEAVRRYVRPGMKINPCGLQTRPSATIYELSRQFRGRDPGWEYISSAIGGTYLMLAHLGLIKKAIVSFAGEGYPTPGPSPIIFRALQSGKFELENYTMLTISERLLAGAMGVPFIPTRSLVGSSIGAEAAEAGQFIETDDPFGSGEKVGYLKAYRPDISFVHAWAADKAGNALVFPPYGENVYGALSAREGVILTVDRIVSTDFIRRHANIGKIPSTIVRSVSVVPYGSHPSGNYASNIPEFVPYAHDYEFMKENRNATVDARAYDAWLDEWVFGVEDHNEYLAKLGDDRIKRLHFLAEPQSWKDELNDHRETLDADRPANSVETMIVVASREAAKRVKEHGYKTMLSGVGQATLLAWLCQQWLRDEGFELTMMAEVGFFGHDPRPADPFVFNYRNIPTTTMLTDIFETLGLHTGGANNQCMGTIGAGQIDRHGNVNSTKLKQGFFIVGSGGANDIATAARETLVVVRQRPGAFVDKVDYITSPGKNVQIVLSNKGRFEKRGGDDLMLTGYFEKEGVDKATAIEEIVELCGWDLEAADDIEALAVPTAEELALLRVFDPERLFLGKAAKGAAAEPAVAKA